MEKKYYSEIDHDKPLTLEYASSLLIASFRLSQGNGELQRDLFTYLHKLRPSWEMDDTFIDDLRELGGQEAVKMLRYSLEENKRSEDVSILHATEAAPATALTELEVYDQISERLQDMADSFVIPHSQIPYDLVGLLTRQVVEADYKYLCERGGRPRTFHRQKVAASAVADPWLSHLCYYGFERNSTGIPEFDLMFQEIVLFVTNSSSFAFDPEYSSFYTKLVEVTAVYSTKHQNIEIAQH